MKQSHSLEPVQVNRDFKVTVRLTSYQTKWGFHWAVIVFSVFFFFFEETSKAVEKSMIHTTRFL